MNDVKAQPAEPLEEEPVSRETEINPQKGSRKMLLGVAAVFFGPLLLATILYSRLDLWQPSSRGNHGELLLPIKPLDFLQLQTTNQDNPVTLETVFGRWTLVYISEGGCNLDCEADLFKIRQVRTMMGRDISRVQTLYIALDQGAADAFSALKDEHQSMIYGQSLEGNSDRQKRAFGEESQGFIYLLDPHGNLVLRYGNEAGTKGIKRDMHKLLRLSRIG